MMPGRCGVFTWWGQTQVTGGKYAFLMSSGDQPVGTFWATQLLPMCFNVMADVFLRWSFTPAATKAPHPFLHVLDFLWDFLATEIMLGAGVHTAAGEDLRLGCLKAWVSLQLSWVSSSLPAASFFSSLSPSLFLFSPCSYSP